MEQSIEFSCMCSEVILCVAYNFYAASKPDTPLLCGWCEINCNEVLFVNGEKKEAYGLKSNTIRMSRHQTALIFVVYS